MTKNASLPVRLDPDLQVRIENVATRLHLTKSAIIRMLLEAMIEEWDRSGGKIVLPLQFTSEERRESSSLMKVAEQKPVYNRRKKE